MLGLIVLVMSPWLQIGAICSRSWALEVQSEIRIKNGIFDVPRLNVYIKQFLLLLGAFGGVFCILRGFLIRCYCDEIRYAYRRNLLPLTTNMRKRQIWIHLGTVQVKGMRFVSFWFRRFEKIVLERRLKRNNKQLLSRNPSKHRFFDFFSEKVVRKFRPELCFVRAQLRPQTQWLKPLHQVR